MIQRILALALAMTLASCGDDTGAPAAPGKGPTAPRDARRDYTLYCRRIGDMLCAGKLAELRSQLSRHAGLSAGDWEALHRKGQADHGVPTAIQDIDVNTISVSGIVDETLGFPLSVAPRTRRARMCITFGARRADGKPSLFDLWVLLCEEDGALRLAGLAYAPAD